MSIVTLWVVIQTCSTFAGSTLTDYRAFPTYQEAVDFAAPNPDAVVVNCDAKIYEASLVEVQDAKEE